MTAADAYLARVARGMAGMDRRVREDVLRELRAHVADAVAADGEGALAAMDPPEAVAARYRELYGYGAAYRAMFVVGAAVLAVFTVPVLVPWLGVFGSLLTSLVVLLVLAAYLMAVAVRAGTQVGTLTGLAAFIARLATVLASETAALHLVPDANGWITFFAVSAALVALGVLPGRVKEKWKPRDVTL